MRRRARSRNTPGYCVVLVVILMELATARQRSPVVSTTVYRKDGQQSPLIVLRAGSSVGDEGPPHSELEIYAEDPSWASKVSWARRQYNSSAIASQRPEAPKYFSVRIPPLLNF